MLWVPESRDRPPSQPVKRILTGTFIKGSQSRSGGHGATAGERAWESEKCRWWCGGVSTVAGLFLSGRKRDDSVNLKFPTCLGFHLRKVCTFLMDGQWEKNAFWCCLCARSSVSALMHHLTKCDKSLRNRHYYYYYHHNYYCYLHCTDEETEGQMMCPRWLC